jgi:hypothetical protein
LRRRRRHVTAFLIHRKRDVVTSHEGS